MENKLKKLFEYQKFAQNAHLAAVINNTQNATNEDSIAELSSDQLLCVTGGKQDERKEKTKIDK